MVLFRCHSVWYRSCWNGSPKILSVAPHYHLRVKEQAKASSEWTHDIYEVRKDILSEWMKKRLYILKRRTSLCVQLHD